MATHMLARSDFQSETWRRLAAYVDDRIATLQLELENPKLPDASTALLRGRIAELRKLTGLPEMVDPSDSDRPGDQTDPSAFASIRLTNL